MGYKELKCEDLPLPTQSDLWWDYYLKRESSVISRLFQGQLMNSTKCLMCGHYSYAFDNFMDLSIPIPRAGVRITGQVSIASCLKEFVKKERMDKCGYKCEKCKAVDNFEKEMTIYRFPRVLVLHLKRFYNSFMRREKINTLIDIPMTLDIAEFAPHSSHPSKEQAQYQLYGISHHSGSLYGGHYVGEVLGDNGKWYDCNDSWVTSTNEPDTNSSSAYVLFYINL
mmetsp:Transcript_6618/g.4967  ORF Transcript_6618/g.4967 Transcript_6618/m.4967 type:complete len:225 (+) Transcript_6618:886-1560(+)|eukprot:CAMPEP_0202961954 /NCGR_PEP_ID=MMETSP1396-20130829/6057_1 /ASSEMBLY_ACC=CAM_ASM_000872 /TAXON_ID= /ORGANISM="Pseudokeronopsis sp., Strain Brazil" /LENGTH=224 /DNA_ID=CAMNT_0049682199 /DNA_START=923 /DNA_END=1597 /DNA_ORIENTATION=+